MDIKNIKTEMDQSVNELKESLSNDINEDILEEVKVKYLSKKGIVSNYQNLMKQVEDKKAFGLLLNDFKNTCTEYIEVERENLKKARLNEKLKNDQIDVTAPSREITVGSQNLLLQTARSIEDIFIKMGFEIALGYEVETDFYNFEALNLAKDHPARDMQDTFYINPNLLLRTHTSNSQARTLKDSDDKSFKIITPGKVYRRDDDDATHSHQFMQIEGMVVLKKDQKIYASLKELKTVLTIFMKEFFETDDVTIRMRPSYFPFTEPSVEVDVNCTNCKGNGCSICKNTGWIEVLGAGIVHKKVLELGGYKADEYTGYAFGIGVERLAMLKHNVVDIRIFYQNDYRFLEHFKKGVR